MDARSIRLACAVFSLLACGASHVALGTVLFADPEAPTRIRDELTAEASARGYENPLEAHAVAVVRSEKSLQIAQNGTA